MKATDLYADGPAAGAKAKILLIHFDGAIDAGAAGRMAIGQLLRSLHNERVATFDADTLMDYRSHRPIVTVDNWVSSPDMVMPETVLDLVEDDMGNPILVLHGAEPDAHWESFTAAIREICERAGVEITFSLHGVPRGFLTRVPRPSTCRRPTSRCCPRGLARSRITCSSPRRCPRSCRFVWDSRGSVGSRSSARFRTTWRTLVTRPRPLLC